MPLTKLVTLMVMGIDSKLFELIFYQKIFKQILKSGMWEVFQFEHFYPYVIDECKVIIIVPLGNQPLKFRSKQCKQT